MISRSTYGVSYYSRYVAAPSIIIPVAQRRSGGNAIIPKSETDYVDAREAARLLGLSQRAVRNLASQQLLEVRREGEGATARLVVSLSLVERLRLEREAAGKN